jgi:hypothetical protein
MAAKKNPDLMPQDDYVDSVMRPSRAVKPVVTPQAETTTTTNPPTTTAPPYPVTEEGQPDITKMTPTQLAAYFSSISGGQNSGTTGLPSYYKPPTRKWTDKQGRVRTYNGTQLINLKTGATQDMYLLDQDPTAIIGTKLSTDGPQGLLKFLKNLESLGFYQGGRVGNGTSDNDVAAVAGFLRYSNMQGLEMNSALTVAQQQIPPNFRVGQSSVRVTNPSDLKAIFESVAMSTIGRGLSDAQLNSMIAAYQQQERAQEYGNTAAPNAEVYASEQLRQKFKGEAQDFRAMNVADSMLSIIRGA